MAKRDGSATKALPIKKVELNGNYSLRFTLKDGTEVDVIVSGMGEGQANAGVLRRRLHEALTEALAS